MQLLVPGQDHCKKTRCVIVCQVTKEPRPTSGILRAPLALADVIVHESGKHGTPIACMEELQEERHCSPKRSLLPVCSLID